MNYTPQTQIDCGPGCDPCGTFSLEGCAQGVPYIQLAAIGGENTTVRWMNLETGDLTDVKPAGFLTGECAEPSNLVTVFTGTEADPNAENVTGGATELDNMTYLQIDNDTGVVGMWKYSAAEGEWIEIPLPPSEVRDHYLQGVATAGMTTITLGKAPVFNTDGTDNGRPLVTRNGIDISQSFSWVGAVGTYDPALNEDCVWDAGDKFQVHYEAVV